MGEIAGIAHGMGVVEGCGAMRERKLGVKWDETPIFHSPISPIFPEVNELPRSFLCKHQRTALTDRKMRTFASHQHSPPQVGGGTTAVGTFFGQRFGSFGQILWEPRISFCQCDGGTS